MPLKLKTDQNSKTLLLKTMFKFNSACNFVSNYAFSNKIWHAFALHKNLYYTIKEKFDLPAQFACNVFARVANSYKTDKKSEHKFNKYSSVEYDKNSVTLKNLTKTDFIDKNTISISTIDKRIKCLKVQYNKNIKLEKLSNYGNLVYKNKQFYLNILTEVPEVTITTHSEYLGVDMGIINLATTSSR